MVKDRKRWSEAGIDGWRQEKMVGGRIDG
jgi:hypothetical protein